MKQETLNWLNQAEEHKQDAEFCLKGSRYSLSLYCYHQALEKIIKAAIIEYKNVLPPKSHQLDFIFGLTGLKAKEDWWVEEMAAITRHFWKVRYPDFRNSPSYESKEKVMAIVTNFDEIYSWIKKQFNNT